MNKRLKKRFKFFSGIISDEKLMNNYHTRTKKSEEEKEFELLLKQVKKDSNKNPKLKKSKKNNIFEEEYIFEEINFNVDEAIDELIHMYENGEL